MSTFKLICTKFWIKVLEPVWSLVVNSLFWVGHLPELANARKTKEELARLPLGDVMANFRWKEDNFKDWTPWVITIIARRFQDDCDGAAALAKWHIEANGGRGDVVNLFSATGSCHTICVAGDRSFFVSNDDVVPIVCPGDWKDNVIMAFGGRYLSVL